MDWFERLTGFRESTWTETQAKLEVAGTTLRSRVNGATYDIGTLELVALQALRDRVAGQPALRGRLSVDIVRGNARDLHQSPENADALFQVASQFNLLEMVCPDVTPDDGVTRYEGDGTQGPACAIAAGAAAIYRNYFVPVGAQTGQTRDRQLDGLAPLGALLAEGTGLPVDALWTMRNGYAVCTRKGLLAIDRHLASLDAMAIDRLRAALCIGLHHEVEVTDEPHDVSIPTPASGSNVRPRVSQAFCSALPLGYGEDRTPALWRSFATLVLEAAYEATLCAALAQAHAGGSRKVLLTSLGGGVFRNDETWIIAAMVRALRLFEDSGLDVRVVSYTEPSAALEQMVAMFNGRQSSVAQPGAPVARPRT